MIVLVALIAAALAVMFVWMRGLWRAMGKLGEPSQATSPTSWVRRSQVMDKWERYIPTNDLVVRTFHTLERAFGHTSPPDGQLASRVLALAKSKGGVVTGLDLVFHEGFGLDEAHEVGAKLTGVHEGQILVDNEGELAFAFSPSVLQRVGGAPEQDMGAEYVTFASGRIARRPSQQDDMMPLNLVGWNKSHMDASAKLVAGTYLMAGMLVWAVSSDAFLLQELHMSQGHQLVVAIITGLMALGTASLVMTARYVAVAQAALGARRDMRRAALHWVHRALDHGRAEVNLGEAIIQLHKSLEPAWPGLDQEAITAEVRAVAVDLDLDLTGQPGEVYSLARLRQRLGEDDAFAAVFDFEQARAESRANQGNDEVIFDTAIEHAQVRALGRA